VRFSVAARLGVLVLAAMVVVSVVAGGSVLTAREQAAQARAMATISDAMSRQWNADMMHDALRADVFAALAEAADRQHPDYGASEVSDHAAALLTDLDQARGGAPAALQQDYAAARAASAAYGAQAREIVTLTRHDRARALTDLPGFMTSFADLEDRLGRLDDALGVAVRVRSQASAAAGRDAVLVVVLTFLLGAVALSALSALIVRGVVRPLRQMDRQLSKVAAGDLRAATQVRRRDELGDLARSIDTTIAAVREGFSVMAGCAGTLHSRSDGLRAASGDLSSAAHEASDRAHESVALADRVATDADQVSTGIRTVSGQTGEIARSATAAAEVARRAMDGAEVASAAISRLGESSAQISGVASMIRSISDQTRLLALNATIEAARAGDAGRGFAVVANEVKDLAQEVGRATEDISGRITAIQQEVQGAVRGIEGVTAIIAEINSHQVDITEAVTGQAETSAHVAVQIGAASEDAAGIARAVGDISAAAAQTSSASRATLEAAGDLTDTAGQMQAILARFSF
jgi:methyl-accepting chemotaxis protein